MKTTCKRNKEQAGRKQRAGDREKDRGRGRHRKKRGREKVGGKDADIRL